MPLSCKGTKCHGSPTDSWKNVVRGLPKLFGTLIIKKRGGGRIVGHWYQNIVWIMCHNFSLDSTGFWQGCEEEEERPAGQDGAPAERDRLEVQGQEDVEEGHREGKFMTSCYYSYIQQISIAVYIYRVTRQLESYILLTSKQKFIHSIDSLY